MVPPLVVDPAPIIAAKVRKFWTAISRAKTCVTIQAVLAQTAADPTIGRREKAELARHGRERIKTLGDAMFVKWKR